MLCTTSSGTHQGLNRTPGPARTHATNPWFETIGRLAPTARIQLVPDSSHFPMVDQPEALNRCLGTFFADVLRRGFFDRMRT